MFDGPRHDSLFNDISSFSVQLLNTRVVKHLQNIFKVKKSISNFLMAVQLRRGEGVKAVPLRKKNFFKIDTQSYDSH